MSDVVRVPISEIVVGERKRSLGDVTPLAESIAELGLLQPIVITDDRRLVAGMHRLEACRKLGWQEIDARIVQADDMRAELAEIDENLVRNELTALERAEQLARRKAIYEALHPETKKGVAQAIGLHSSLGHNVAAESAVTFTDDAAAKTGLASRTIREEVQIATRIPDDVRELLRATPLADRKTELLELARKPEQEQRDIAERIATGQAKTVLQASRQLSEAARANDLIRPVHVALPDGIHRGDFRILSEQIPDNSVELVFTDPPYDGDSVQLYEDAARIACRILKPGGSMIAYSGHKYLPQVLTVMSRHLRYWWTLAAIHGGGAQILEKLGVRCGWKPLVWFVKGTRGDVTNVMLDTVRGEREKDVHEWQQSVIEATSIIEKLCPSGGTVVDFFLGGGTTAMACQTLGRRFIGFETDARAIERSVGRLSA